MRLARGHAGVDVHPVLRLPGLLCRHLGRMAGTCRTAQGRRGLGRVLVRRHAAVGAGHSPAPVLAHDPGLGRDRGYRAGAWLHLPRVHPDQVVP
jgi:hypothetical protein